MVPLSTGTRPAEALVPVPSGDRKGSLLASWLSSTDHKVIGHLYLITSFGFFLIAGLMAMIMRAQLTGPGNHIVSDQQYNELFTMHGTIMLLLLFATPLFVGFANEIMPLQIGAPGTVVFCMFSGFYFWWPKFTGKKLDETLGKWHFWTLFIGFHMTFLVQHWIGTQGMPRRVASYPDLPAHMTMLNQISSAGSFILGASTLFFLWNVYLTSRRPERVTKDDPWGYANSLEWATSCPPPRHNFTRIPRIRSERPAFDLHYPHIRSGRSRASAPAAHPERGPAAR